MQKLLKKLMILNPKDRGSLKEIMWDPWLNTSQEETLRPYSESIDPWVSEEMINLEFEWDQTQDSLKSKMYNSVMATYLILSTKKPQVENHTNLARSFCSPDPRSCSTPSPASNSEGLARVL